MRTTAVTLALVLSASASLAQQTADAVQPEGATDGQFTSIDPTVAAALEAKALGKPVTASNHALAWHMLRLAGVDDQIAGYGRLFALGLSD